jgi:hypothetical protein
LGNQAGAGYIPVTPYCGAGDAAAVKLLMVRHGAGAAMRAAQRADELLKEGDIDGVAIWRRILEAIGGLTRGRQKGEAVN